MRPGESGSSFQPENGAPIRALTTRERRAAARREEVPKESEEAKWKRKIESAVENGEITDGILSRAQILSGKEPWVIWKELCDAGTNDSVKSFVEQIRIAEKEAGDVPKRLLEYGLVSALLEERAAEIVTGIFLEDNLRKEANRRIAEFGFGHAVRIADPPETAAQLIGEIRTYIKAITTGEHPYIDVSTVQNGTYSMRVFPSVITHRGFYTMLYALAGEHTELFGDGSRTTSQIRGHIDSLGTQMSSALLTKIFREDLSFVADHYNGIRYFPYRNKPIETQMRQRDMLYARSLAQRIRDPRPVVAEVSTPVPVPEQPSDDERIAERNAFDVWLWEYRTLCDALEKLPEEIPPAKAFLRRLFARFSIPLFSEEAGKLEANRQALRGRIESLLQESERFESLLGEQFDLSPGDSDFPQQLLELATHNAVASVDAEIASLVPGSWARAKSASRPSRPTSNQAS